MDDMTYSMGFAPIVYICDGKIKRCRNDGNCRYKDPVNGECCHTIDEAHAKYGKCDGLPEWFPERFYKEDRGQFSYYWEKNHF